MDGQRTTKLRWEALVACERPRPWLTTRSARCSAAGRSVAGSRRRRRRQRSTGCAGCRSLRGERRRVGDLHFALAIHFIPMSHVLAPLRLAAGVTYPILSYPSYSIQSRQFPMRFRLEYEPPPPPRAGWSVTRRGMRAPAHFRHSRRHHHRCCCCCCCCCCRRRRRRRRGRRGRRPRNATCMLGVAPPAPRSPIL